MTPPILMTKLLSGLGHNRREVAVPDHGDVPVFELTLELSVGGGFGIEVGL